MMLASPREVKISQVGVITCIAPTNTFNGAADLALTTPSNINPFRNRTAPTYNRPTLAMTNHLPRVGTHGRGNRANLGSAGAIGVRRRAPPAGIEDTTGGRSLVAAASSITRTRAPRTNDNRGAQNTPTPTPPHTRHPTDADAVPIATDTSNNPSVPQRYSYVATSRLLRRAVGSLAFPSPGQRRSRAARGRRTAGASARARALELRSAVRARRTSPCAPVLRSWPRREGRHNRVST